ncbi:hypothetical protein L2089_15520 [Paenibacillus hunanensis]|uniref:hypothetical protein n=1 Tax=Paenibacillus hunanensis TaxID=539262 RepID=UPI0020274B07|nr:hypothetical protein [Paenibacillus hunanensis]MCL9662103.1 hypothetical protein [Paenibacillus hunanensis]
MSKSQRIKKIIWGVSFILITIIILYNVDYNYLLMFILIFIGISLPIILTIAFKRSSIFFKMSLCLIIPLINFFVVPEGLQLVPDLYSNEKVVLILFYICLFEVLIIELLLLTILCIDGAVFLISPRNPWYALGKIPTIIMQFSVLIAYLILPDIVFSLMYGLCSVATSGFYLPTYDAYYYSLAVNYLIPLSGIFSEFQQQVNSSGLLRIIQIIHLVYSKMIDLLILSFIVSKINETLKEQRSSDTLTEGSFPPRSKRKK